MNKSNLKNDVVKEQVISMDTRGMSSREISRETGIPKSCIGDFLRKETYIAFWTERDAKEVEVQAAEEVVFDVESSCESDDFDVASLAKRLRSAQRTNSQLRRIINGINDSTDGLPVVLKAIELAASKVAKNAAAPTRVHTSVGKPKAIYEILFSDYQIGKIGQYYNSQIAEASMKSYGRQVLENLTNSYTKYSPERIILASLGDIMEDHLKHGVQSAVSTDCGLAEQMALAIDHVWNYLLKPLAEEGIPMTVIGVAGNHSSSEHKGMDMFKAGKFCYDYVVYKALEGYCKALGFNHVEFQLPEGAFTHSEIFGKYVVYNHGYGHTCTEKALEAERSKRGDQLKKHIEYYRCGDMHHVCNFDAGRLVVNGAFFGVDSEGIEYSGILGFSSLPAQVMMIHTEEGHVGRSSIKETFVIQVADGY